MHISDRKLYFTILTLTNFILLILNGYKTKDKDNSLVYYKESYIINLKSRYLISVECYNEMKQGNLSYILLV
jgi:hypothetical protein